MRAFKFALPLVLALMVAGNVWAEEKKDAPKEEKWTGVLSAKGADAKEGVAAVLTVKAGDKEVKVNVHADGDLAKAIAEHAAKGAKVEVTGTKVDDTNVKATKCEAAKEATK